MREQKRKHVAVDTNAPTDTIPYDDAVSEGKEIIAAAERGQLRLGELADKLEPRYGDGTLAKFADAIDVTPCVLARYRDVYRAWKDIYAPGRKLPSYSVLRELAAHPEREQIIRDNPNLTKREAHEIMRKLEGAEEEKQEQKQETEWLRDNRRWFKDVVALANEATSAAGVVDECTPEQLDNLLQVVEPHMLSYVRRGGKMLVALSDRLEALLEEQELSEPVEAFERAHPEATAQAPVHAAS